MRGFSLRIIVDCSFTKCQVHGDSLWSLPVGEATTGLLPRSHLIHPPPPQLFCCLRQFLWDREAERGGTGTKNTSRPSPAPLGLLPSVVSHAHGLTKATQSSKGCPDRTMGWGQASRTQGYSVLETTVSCGNEVGKGVFWHLREQVAQRCWYHRRPRQLWAVPWRRRTGARHREVLVAGGERAGQGDCRLVLQVQSQVVGFVVEAMCSLSWPIVSGVDEKGSYGQICVGNTV